MVDFSDAFYRGLDAARQARSNRDEVKEIFRQLNEGLSKASEGNAEIAIVEFQESRGPIAALANIFEAPAKYQAIVVRHAKHEDFGSREVARWKQDQNGYPCFIITPERQASCDSGEALVSELSTLFATPRVGEAIFAAMQHQPKPAQGPAGHPA